MKVGLLSNLKSRRNRAGRDRLNRILEAYPHVVSADISGIEEIGPVLMGFAKSGVELVAINGGDGTVDAVLTAMITGAMFDPYPPVALLAGGTTNMTAGDVGVGGAPARALQRLARATAPPGAHKSARTALTYVERPLIEVHYKPDASPLYGLFFGAGAIPRAALLSRRFLEPGRSHAGLGVAATFATALAQAAIARVKTTHNQNHGVFRPEAMVIQTDTRPDRPPPQTQLAPEPYLLVLVTTLERLLFRSRPFWGTQPRPLHFTAIRHPPNRFLRAVVPVLYGGAAAKRPSEDYISENVSRITLHLDNPFLLDGEIYMPHPSLPVTLEAGPSITFVQC